MKAFRDLFSVLKGWELDGCLSLDITVYSTSNSGHWFKYLTIQPHVLPNVGSHDPGAEQAVPSGVDDACHRTCSLDLGWLSLQSATERDTVQIMEGDGILDDGEHEA